MLALSLALGLQIGLLMLTFALLNARDRRRDCAIAAVTAACPRSMRGLLAVHARAPVLSRRVVVTVDLSECDLHEVWMAVRPMAEAVPRHVALVIGARVDATVPVTLGVVLPASAVR